VEAFGSFINKLKRRRCFEEAEYEVVLVSMSSTDLSCWRDMYGGFVEVLLGVV
jgi:hypothetical protein